MLMYMIIKRDEGWGHFCFFYDSCRLEDEG